MQPGDSLDGRYTIIGQLGAGGMGEVYKATHNYLGATRVIKIIHPHISGRQDAHERFLREARIATKVQHPNVATLHDFASLSDGSHYMVWEFIDGENLAQRLRTRGTLPPRAAVRIAIQALRGLEAIHAAGIIHRDISPENLMITAGDAVKIIDLGVAKMDDPDAVSQTRTGIFVGKLRYAAPEQLGFLPENERIDGRTDLYALAMVLVELLTGRPPYEAKSPHEYFLHHAREVQRTTVSLPPAMPGGSALVAVLEKALERDRNDRFATARDFANALEEIERTLPVAADTPTVMTPIDVPTLITPLDGDDTFKQRATKPGTTSQKPIPVMAAPTIQTPLPAAMPPAKQRSGINPAYVIGFVLLLIVVAGGALAFKITSARPAIEREPAATSKAAPSQPSQSTITATPEPIVTATVVPAQDTAAQAPPVLTSPAVKTLVVAPRVVRNEPRAEDLRQPESEPEPEPSRVRSVGVYVEGPGSVGANERALARLRQDLRGVNKVALHAGALQVPVYRAIHRYLPELEFDEESDVVITFDSTPQRLGLDKHDISARVTIQKGGRAIFHYELPRHYDRSAAPDAFARTLAEAFGE